MLKDFFLSLSLKYTDDVILAETLWMEIEKAYNGKKRFYHNLTHLQNMYNELQACAHLITDWDTILFSLYYHDIVYKATSKENEEKSALIAVDRLLLMQFPTQRINACSEQVLATKHHNLNSNADTNLLIDADMAILGYNWGDYKEYYEAVRKEYAIYPDFLYNPGRAKVLRHFLSGNNMYSTTFFKEKYESKARNNIQKELALLI